MDKIFKALADKNRRKILSILINGDKTVSEILKDFEITQATLSSHLAILRKAKLVDSRINGRERIYFMNRDLFEKFVEELNRFVSEKPKEIIQKIKPVDEIISRRSR